MCVLTLNFKKVCNNKNTTDNNHLPFTQIHMLTFHHLLYQFLSFFIFPSSHLPSFLLSSPAPPPHSLFYLPIYIYIHIMLYVFIQVYSSAYSFIFISDQIYQFFHSSSWFNWFCLISSCFLTLCFRFWISDSRWFFKSTNVWFKICNTFSSVLL